MLVVWAYSVRCSVSDRISQLSGIIRSSDAVPVQQHPQRVYAMEVETFWTRVPAAAGGIKEVNIIFVYLFTIPLQLKLPLELLFAFELMHLLVNPFVSNLLVWFWRATDRHLMMKARLNISVLLECEF